MLPLPRIANFSVVRRIIRENVRITFSHGPFVAVTGDLQEPDCMSVVLEGSVVIDDVSDFPTTICLFFTLHYAVSYTHLTLPTKRIV